MTALILLLGPAGAGKSALIAHWLQHRPATERWAVLGVGTGLAALAPWREAALDARAEVRVESLAAACACCVTRVSFQTCLGRLLAQGPWDRVFIEAPLQGHCTGLVELVRDFRFAVPLRRHAPLAVFNARQAEAAIRVEPGPAADLCTLARAVVIMPSSVATDGDSGSKGLCEALARRPPWPRPVLDARGQLPSLAETSAALVEEAPLATPGPHPLAGDLPGLRWVWPDTVVFDRARLKAMLDALAAPGGLLTQHQVCAAQGVFRTARATYLWQWSGGVANWDESAWRADSRLEWRTNRSLDPWMVDLSLPVADSAG